MQNPQKIHLVAISLQINVTGTVDPKGNNKKAKEIFLHQDITINIYAMHTLCCTWRDGEKECMA
jgi:hypothetical protein